MSKNGRNGQNEHQESLGEEILHKIEPPKRSFFARLRANFLAGILIIAPISITIYLGWIFIDFIDRTVSKVLPAKYNPETYIPISIPGLGVVVMLIFVTLVGALTAGYIGRFFINWSEKIVERMPILRSIYGAVKQIFETVLTSSSDAFREVVIFEYPRKGSWAMGFITGVTQGEIQNLTEDEVINVFLPTTPNPTSGYLLFVPRRDLVILDMSVEDGIKMVVSGGIVTPPDSRPKAKQKKPLIPAV